MIKNLRRNLLIGVGLGVAVYFVMGLYADYNELLASFRRFDWLMLPAALALVCASYVLRFLRWEFLLRIIDIRIPTRPSVAIFLSGLTMSISPAKLGEVMKSFLLKDYAGVKISRSSSVVVAERLADVIAVVILASIGTLAYGLGWKILLVTTLLIGAFVATVQTRSICTWLLHLAERMPLIGRFAGHLEEFYEASYTLFKIRHLVPMVAVSTAGWFLECIASWLLLKGLGVDAELLMVTFVFNMGTLAGAMAMVPGGLGVAEGSMTGLFVANGIARNSAVAATMLIRLITFWFAIVVGLLALTLYGAVVARNPVNGDGDGPPQ